MFRRRIQPPEWAAFMAADEWRRFETLIRGETAPRGLKGDVRTGVLNAGEEKYGLQNIAQICHAEPAERWPALLRTHFDSLRDRDDPPVSIATLKARLVDDGYATGDHVAREVADDLRLVLASDLAAHVRVDKRDELLALGDEEELFAHALAQTRAEPGLELTRHELAINDAGDTAPIFVLQGDSFFTATHALWADELDPPPSEHGALVAVPTRHAVLFHPIRDGRMFNVLGRMFEMAREIEREGPGSISNALYWLREGRLKRLDVQQEGLGPRFTPDAEFVEMLTHLP
jgi:hypothetical protein